MVHNFTSPSDPLKNDREIELGHKGTCLDFEPQAQIIFLYKHKICTNILIKMKVNVYLVENSAWEWFGPESEHVRDSR